METINFTGCRFLFTFVLLLMFCQCHSNYADCFPCTNNSDCPGNLECKNNICEGGLGFSCKNDYDCHDSLNCEKHICVGCMEICRGKQRISGKRMYKPSGEISYPKLEKLIEENYLLDNDLTAY